MQVVTVGYASNGRYLGAGRRPKGRTCKICVRVLREGQRVLRVDDWTFLHLPCLRDTVGDDPAFLDPSVVLREFEALRKKLVETYAGGRHSGT